MGLVEDADGRQHQPGPKGRGGRERVVEVDLLQRDLAARIDPPSILASSTSSSERKARRSLKVWARNTTNRATFTLPGVSGPLEFL